MNMQIRKPAVCLLAFGTLLCCGSCGMDPVDVVDKVGIAEEILPVETDQTAPVTLATQETYITTVTTPAVPPDINVSVVAVGDNLVQTHVYLAAQAQAGGAEDEYNFAPLYEGIKPIVEEADVAIINQETLICGDEDQYEIYGSIFNLN